MDIKEFFRKGENLIGTGFLLILAVYVGWLMVCDVNGMQAATTKYDYYQNLIYLIENIARTYSCPYFTTAVYDLDEPMTLDYSELDSFVILIAVKGEGTISANGKEMSFKMGDTVLLPATTGEVKVEGTIKFLETFV